jgi:WD40 repeat protein
MPSLATVIPRAAILALRSCAVPRLRRSSQWSARIFLIAILCSPASAMDPEPLFEIESFTFPAISVTRDGSQVAVGGRKKGGGAGIRIYDSTTWKLVHELSPTGASVKAIAFSADGGRIFGAIGNDIVVWHLPSGEEHGRLSRHAQDVFSLAVSGDGTYLFSGGEDGRIMRWNVRTLAHVGEFKPHIGWIRGLVCHPATGSLAAAGDNGLFRVWKRGDPASAINVKHDGDESLFGVSLSLDSKRFAALTAR